MIIQGDCLHALKGIRDETVDCCITSPPYYALRDYKTEGQIGLEKTFEEYLDKLIAVFTEVKRVLKRTGTCWVVMGDTYAGGGNFNNGNHGCVSRRVMDNKAMPRISKQNYPSKTLLMMPSRFAIAMIDSGWILRNDIIWYKPNCMPSSAKDRFTVDYEHIFFFTKDKKYYFKTQYEPLGRPPQKYYPSKLTKNNIDKFNNSMWSRTIKSNIESPDRVWGSEVGRIKRTVWKIPPKPFPEAHFAVFPEELVKQCIDPGCPEQGTVLDPFMGAGTVPLVALKTGRQFIGIEINKDYIEIAKKRIAPYLLQTKLIME